jgi:hypothetical protein
MSKPFTIVYPDRSKKNVTASFKDRMLVSGEIEKVDACTYRFVGDSSIFRCNSLQGLSAFKPRLAPLPYFTRFYPGFFVWEHAGKKHREMLESPENLALRIKEKVA